MLEFLGFIALLAIIFGVSFSTALTGFFKVILIGIAVCALIAVIIKLCEKFWGAIVVLIGGLVAIYLGCIMIEDNVYTNDLKMCSTYNSAADDMRCMTNAIDRHNEVENRGWGFAIGGGAAAVAGAYCAYSKRDDVKQAKKRSAA